MQAIGVDNILTIVIVCGVTVGATELYTRGSGVSEDATFLNNTVKIRVKENELISTVRQISCSATLLSPNSGTLTRILFAA